VDHRTVRFLIDIIMTLAAVAAAAANAAVTTTVFALTGTYVDGWEAFTIAIFYVLIVDDLRAN
jgi:hypothetical protein